MLLLLLLRVADSFLVTTFPFLLLLLPLSFILCIVSLLLLLLPNLSCNYMAVDVYICSVVLRLSARKSINER